MHKHLTAKHAILQSAYWMSTCINYAFAEVFLSAYGLTSTQIGIALATAHVAAAVLQPVIGSILDRNRKLNARQAITLMAVIAIVFAVGDWLGSGPAVVAVFFVALSTMTIAILPLINSIAFDYIDNGEKLNFSIARGIASLSYALLVIVFGKLAEYNVDYLLPGYILINIGMIASLRMFKSQPVRVIAENKQAGGVFELLKKQWRFGLMLLGFTLMFVVHQIIFTYMLRIVQEVGGGVSERSTAIMISTVLEIPIMLLFTRIEKRIPCYRLLMIAACVFTLKDIILILPLGIWGVYFAQFLQFGCYALMIPGITYYVNDIMDDTDKIKGQALVSSAMSISSVAGCLGGGVLMDNVGVHTTLIIGVAISAIGTLLFCLFTKNPSRTAKSA